MDGYRALLIGNSSFPADPQNLQELHGPVKDVAMLGAALTDQSTGLFESERVGLLVERPAAKILEEIEAFFFDARRDDQLLLYYSGHGLLDERNQLYLAAANTRTDRLRSTAVSAADVSEMLDNCAARTAVILLDCCHSGAFKGNIGPANLAGSGRFVLTSCRSGELANDADRRNGTSLFTQHLVDGLIREARDVDGDGRIDVDDVYRYVHERLLQSNRQIPQRRFDGSARTPALARRDPAAVPAGAAAAAPAPTPVEDVGATPPPPEGSHPGLLEPAPRRPGRSGPAWLRDRRRLVLVLGGVALACLLVAIAVSVLPDGEKSAPEVVLPRGPADLQNPLGISLDTGGNLLIADSERNRVMRVAAGRGEITRVAGTDQNRPFVPGLPAPDTRIVAPRLVAAVPAGGFVVANNEQGLLNVRGDGLVEVLQPQGPPGMTSSPITAVVATATNLLYVADATRVGLFDPDTGQLKVVAGSDTTGFSGDGDLAERAALNDVRGLALDREAKNLYIADCGNDRVRRIDLVTNVISTFAGRPDVPFEEGGLATQVGLSCPSGLAVGPDGAVYLIDNKTHVRTVVNQRIATAAGPIREGIEEFYEDGRPATETKLQSLNGLAVDANGGVFMSDGFHRVRYVDPTSRIVSTRA